MSNGIVRLIVLTGGGHIAEMHLERAKGARSVNPLWTPPWKTIEPYRYRDSQHRRRFGPLIEGKLLSGIAGHSLCLDYFGLPSVEEAAHGLSLHGEAPVARWRVVQSRRTGDALSLEMSVRLPTAQLQCQRRVELQRDEPVTLFTETVQNERKADHFFHWTEHVTLGPPFLDPRSSSVAIPGDQAGTYPHGYDEGKALLASNATFRWPDAPLADGGAADLRQPLIRPGLGFVATVLVDPQREFGYVAALNWKLGVVIAYCYRRSDFPWVAVWEENLAIAAPPWRRRTRARGLEFGTTPFPVPRRESFLGPRLFGEPALTSVAAGGAKTVRYVAVLAKIPPRVRTVHDIALERDRVSIICDSGPAVVVRSSMVGQLFQ
jgi:hypothetical protein